jgi:Protein of unknown function (DUF3606)
MREDRTKTGKPDRHRVNIDEDYERRYWCGKWGCSESGLYAAVSAVGVMAKEVEAWLWRNGKIR